MKNFFLRKLLKYLGKKLDGAKSYLGGGAMLLYAIVGAVGNMFPDFGLPTMDTPEMQALFKGGLAFFGVGVAHKAQKLIDAVKEPAPKAATGPSVSRETAE